jgi:hypothetical protein
LALDRHTQAGTNCEGGRADAMSCRARTGRRPSRPGSRGVPPERLPWRITNVLLRVDSVDASRAVTASAFGSVLGGVKAGGRCCRHRQHGHASRRRKSPGATNDEPTHLRCLNGCVSSGA